MEEIRRSPVELGSLSHYLQGFIHPRWCRISEPSTVFLASFSKPQLLWSIPKTWLFLSICPSPKKCPRRPTLSWFASKAFWMPQAKLLFLSTDGFFFERKLPGRKQQNYMHPFEEITANMPNAHGSNVEPWGSWRAPYLVEKQRVSSRLFLGWEKNLKKMNRRIIFWLYFRQVSSLYVAFWSKNMHTAFAVRVKYHVPSASKDMTWCWEQLFWTFTEICSIHQEDQGTTMAQTQKLLGFGLSSGGSSPNWKYMWHLLISWHAKQMDPSKKRMKLDRFFPTKASKPWTLGHWLSRLLFVQDIQN